MNRTPEELRLALLVELASKRGPLELGRAVQRAAREAEHLPLNDILDETLGHNSAAGRRLEQAYSSQGIQFLAITEPAYPQSLKAIPSAPLGLFYCGQLQNLQRPSIAIVGARSCTSYGRQTARKLASDLSALGFVIVSGLALGIDAQAHEACVAAAARTVAVLGSGIDVIYPKAHIEMARAIVHGNGTIVTEFPPGSAPKSHHFPIRNRIISGLCRATIVVEAKERSGSLSTARHCLDQGRELFAVPGPMHHETSLGTHGLIRRGEAHLLSSCRDVVEVLNPFLQLAVSQHEELALHISDPIAQSIYDRLDAFEPTSFDELALDIDTQTGTITSALIHLENLHLAEQLPGQRWLRNPVIGEPSGAHTHG